MGIVKRQGTKRVLGFTMIELLVAATIIAIISAIGMVSYGSTTKKSRDTKRYSDLEQLRTALEMYRADNGWYSGAGAGSFTSAANLSGDLVSTYMPAIPSDPKPSTYQYSYQATSPIVVGGTTRYFGYCLSAYIEGGHAGADPCTPDTNPNPDHNYSAKNP